MSTPEFVASCCPQCGAPLGEGLTCGYCGIRSERVSAEKPRVSVAGEHRDLHVGGITFDRRVGFDDGQLEAIAGQVAAAMAVDPKKNFLDFSLPLPVKPGSPPALWVEAHRGDGESLTVLFISNYIPNMHQRLQAEGRVLNFPSETR